MHLPVRFHPGRAASPQRADPSTSSHTLCICAVFQPQDALEAAPPPNFTAVMGDPCQPGPPHGPSGKLHSFWWAAGSTSAKLFCKTDRNQIAGPLPPGSHTYITAKALCSSSTTVGPNCRCCSAEPCTLQCMICRSKNAIDPSHQTA
jgi:hypothetical protein